MENSKRDAMLHEDIAHLINRLAIPTIISQLITSLYNMADTYWVAQLNNDSATAAVGIVFAIMALIQALGFFCGHGSGNFISRMLGANKVKEARLMAMTGFTLAFILGIVLMAFGLIFLEPLAYALGSTSTMLPYAKEYMSWILIGAPIMMAALVMNNQLRFQGNSFFSMIGITTGGILNIVLDPLFIFVFDLGIAGAAIATIISQGISFILLLWGIMKSDSVSYSLKDIRLDLYHLKNIFKGGFPSLCRQGVSALSTAIVNLCAGPFGDAAIAAVSVVNRIMQFCFSIVIGIAQGFQPVCGYNYGAKRYDRVRSAFSYTVKAGTIFTIFISIFCFLFEKAIMVLFQSDASSQILDIGMVTLRVQCLTLALTVFLTVSSMMLQVVGKTRPASLLASMRQGIALIPVVIIMTSLFGLFGLEIAQAIADVISLLVSIPMVIIFYREMKEEEKGFPDAKAS